MPRLSLPEEFGRLVREMRTERGHSQEAFAYHAGIHRTYMTHIERGSKLPSILVIAKVARGLGVEVSTLFEELERRGATVEATTDEPIIR